MKLYLNRKILSGFILSIVVLLSLGAASFQFIQRVTDVSRSGRNSQQILLSSEYVLALAAELETALLKYAITGEEEFLQSHAGNVKLLQENLDQLNFLTGTRPDQHERVNKLQELLGEKINFYKEISEANTKLMSGSAVESPSDLLLTFRGEQIEQKIRTVVTAIRNAERLLKTEQQAIATDQFYQFIFTFSALLIVGLVTPAILIHALNSNLEARGKAEEKLKLTLEANHDLYENAPCGYFLVDDEGMVTSMNETLLSWLGYSRKEVVDKMYVDKLLIGAAEVFGDGSSRLKAEGTISDVEFQMVRKNLSSIPVILNARVIPGLKGRPITVRCSLFDNTKRKLAEEEAKAVNRELEAFSYSVSHDLRAPLRAINGYAEILREDFGEKLEEDATRVLNIISANSRRMGQLIDDLLRFSKVGKKAINRSYVEMSEIVNPIIDELLDSEKNRDIKIDRKDLGPARVDVSMIRQVWTNLLSNALKYTQKKEQARIEVGCYVDGDERIYYVKDNGAGFDMKFVDKLFGVFQRLHDDEDFQGTGVGLALVKRIIDKHNGRIWVEAVENEGATFYFSLPKIESE